ncbi:LLM class flavin-dependent oxidoreductase [Candidatus Entotheonella palauensis]|uniref:Luciferase-like monooxygenase n=1 Tax=Candidatus Entotheonella gemina TaxID=1429439 RepID=W4MA67_9BACT|nr:LLM class flavin-dependent oxidoreductase [Candidatus Entotheonella palauensis]ETX06527.1 MAG: luciferase [Candidatus Entotheonella gemina]
MGLKLSILDHSPIIDAKSSTEAFQRTIELAQKAEAWGYHRFWVTEHHNSERLAGSSPEVLISHLLAKTSRIRVGSGGVMLQHYSPYKVAENFNVLASLAPGRVDLGIGRGPGGMPQSTKALKPIDGEAKPFPDKLVALGQFLRNQVNVDEDHPLYGLRASPSPEQPADVYLLGTTTASAELAASLGMPYVFALFLNSDEQVMAESIDLYQRQFDFTQGTRPQTLLGLPVMVTDTDEEAAELASQVTVVRIRLESGRSFMLGTVEAAESFGKQSEEKYTITVQQAIVIHGAPETVRKKLEAMQSRYHADEIIAVTQIPDFQKRLYSFELLSDVFAQVTVAPSSINQGGI